MCLLRFVINFAAEMRRVKQIIGQSLSVRLSLKVVTAMAVLLLSLMIAMSLYSRKELKTESLQKTAQTLDATVRRIDNILLSVERTADNVLYGIRSHRDDAEIMYTYSRKVVELNPYVTGCAIAFRRGFFRDGELFMAYYHQTAERGAGSDEVEIVQSDTFGDRPYTEQVWYTEPMATGRPKWLNPVTGMEADIAPIITFCQPIMDEDGRAVGVLGIDVSLSLLSRIVLAAKPTAHSYCTLLSEDGSFIVHPDSSRLFSGTIFTLLDEIKEESAIRAAEAMLSGRSGYSAFEIKGRSYYVFYKPFQRVAEPGRNVDDLGWSAGIVYPEDDILGDYNSLLYDVFAIAGVGLLLLFVLCCAILLRQFRPLVMLMSKAHYIAKGNYNEPIPRSTRKDEIGRLQVSFQKMQETLAANIGELEQLTSTLERDGERLRVACDQAHNADRIKTVFLHNMTNQMIAPSYAICDDVVALCNNGSDRSSLVKDIQKQSRTITELLNNLINLSDEDMRKEAANA